MNHIHTPEDGRGNRDVFLDGKILHDCFYADTELGIVRCFVKAAKRHKGEIKTYEIDLFGNIKTVELTGKVEVKCRAE